MILILKKILQFPHWLQNKANLDRNPTANILYMVAFIFLLFSVIITPEESIRGNIFLILSTIYSFMATFYVFIGKDANNIHK